jgi:hypothetical protein
MSHSVTPQPAQQPTTIPQQLQTTNGQPPMSMVGGGTNVGQQWSTTNGQPPMSMIGGGNNFLLPNTTPNTASFTPPTQAQMGNAPVNTNQMAAGAAAMPQGSGDGIVDGKYDPTQDSQLQQMMGRMKAMQESGAFSTPYQKAQQQHPILMGLANAAQTFAQGITKQPFATSNNENQTALQNANAQGLNAMMTPQNMVNMAMLQQMRGSINPQTAAQQTGTGRGTPASPQQLAALRANAPKGSTGWSPTIGYHDAQGNPVK